MKTIEKLTKEQLDFLKKIEEFAVDAHHSTNHYYDDYLPYEFHLRMAVKAAKDFLYLIEPSKRYIVLAACFLHDSIEDARQNYNSIKKIAGEQVAEIVRAVTNYGRGRDRNERMPDFVYADIKNTECATFVKLCDRIANVQYSKLTGSDMFEKYKKEHEHFKNMLYVSDSAEEDLWLYLEQLFSLSVEV